MRQEPRIQTRLLALPDKPTTHLNVPSGYTDSCLHPLNAVLPSLPPPQAPGHGFLCFLPSQFQCLLSLASSPSLPGTLEYLTSGNLFPHPLFSLFLTPCRPLSRNCSCPSSAQILKGQSLSPPLPFQSGSLRHSVGTAGIETVLQKNLEE